MVLLKMAVRICDVSGGDSDGCCNNGVYLSVFYCSGYGDE